MQTERIQISLRARTGMEAVDLGLRMLRAWWRPVFLSWLVVVVPVALALILALRTHAVIATLLLWWLRPVFARVPLHVLSREIFGERSSVAETVRSLPSLLRSGLGTSLFVQRLSPLRSFLLPVLQLEGLRGPLRRERAATLARTDAAAALGAWLVGAWCVGVIALGLLSGLQLLLPEELAWDVFEIFNPILDDAGEDPGQVLVPLLYLATISIVEPMLVASGFALYLNRRVYLEGWDIELTFRALARRLARPGTPLASARSAGRAAVMLVVGGLLLSTPSPIGAEACAEDELASSGSCIEHVLESPDFGVEREVTRWSLREFEVSDESFSLFPDWFGQILLGGVEVLLWLGLALVLGALVYAVVRAAGTAEPVLPQLPDEPAVHFGLDLDPRNLPDDVVAASRAAWARGDRLAALSLLYRGALVGLASRGALDIPRSATELECVRLVGGGPEPHRAPPFSALTLAWIAARYAGRLPAPDRFEELCADFPGAFGPAIDPGAAP